MKSLNFRSSLLWPGSLLVLCALLWSTFLADNLLRLSADYTYHSDHEGVTTFYDPVTGSFSDLNETIKRDDVVTEDHGDIVVIRSIFRGISPDGDILFEASSRYGVDALSKSNVAGYGDQDRVGQFGFPLYTKPQEYLFHSPEVLEKPSSMLFNGMEEIEGLNVYRFAYFIDNLDKTQYFPDFLSAGETIIGNHQGTIWVEPTSGYIVDWEHSGENWVINPNTGVKTQDFQKWFNEFSDETMQFHLNEAKSAKWSVLLHKEILPNVFLILGLTLMLLSFIFVKKR
jgi:hypothetical protein